MTTESTEVVSNPQDETQKRRRFWYPRTVKQWLKTVALIAVAIWWFKDARYEHNVGPIPPSGRFSADEWILGGKTFGVKYAIIPEPGSGPTMFYHHVISIYRNYYIIYPPRYFPPNVVLPKTHPRFSENIVEIRPQRIWGPHSRIKFAK